MDDAAAGADQRFERALDQIFARLHQYLQPDIIRRAVVFGTALASFTVEKFSLERLKTLTEEQLAARVRMLKELSHFDTP